ncbi:MAG: SDR family oxidoreductase [Candidatus Marinimicrobia bacterium]|nr:SDR family oxidoreductase [Candidatus Neomarinimicrobiota bacterium]
MVKTIVISGATSGFGRSCAERFAEEGWKLILIGRRTKRLEEMWKELSVKTDILTITLDVQDRGKVFETFESLPVDFSKIDVLVNNAGLAMGFTPAFKADINDWDTMIDTNIKGLVYCTRALLPGMVERNAGQIINIGSISGNWPYPGGNVYGATKAFVQQFSRNLRADLHGTKIRVTNLEPGIAETEFSIVRFKGDEKRADKVYKDIQALKAGDISDIVWWIANTPEHINVNQIEVMPTCQTWGPLKIHRE